MAAVDRSDAFALDEAERLMTVCNSCRYCEGLCAVFPAMELRRSFGAGDLNYLANLCHNCGACFNDCQFAPPHEFAVNVPQTLAVVRRQSYAAYAWPAALRPLLQRNALAISLITALSIGLFLLGLMAANSPRIFFAGTPDPRAFYALMPHQAMAWLFGLAFLYAMAALAMGLRAFWMDIGEPAATLTKAPSIWQAMKDAGSLRYLDGGGNGCFNEEDEPTDRRKLFHHLTYYGFLSCFAATVIATLEHYLLGLPAPYPWYSLPVLFGTIGGVAVVLGTGGLLQSRLAADERRKDPESKGMDIAFILMLFLVSLTGLALLFLRATPVMGPALALHLGFVFGFFVTMPYSKFVHGIYRFAALVKYAQERRVVEANA